MDTKKTDSDHSEDGFYEMVTKPEYSSGESFELVGSEESYDRMADFEETLSEMHITTPEPSESYNQITDCEENLRDMHITDMEYEITTDIDDSIGVNGDECTDILINDQPCYPLTQDDPVYYQTRLLEYPLSVKRRAEMEIKDVVAENALHFLPAKSICRFRSVSHDWNGKISRPVFPYHQSTSFRSTSGYFNKHPDVPSFISLNDPAYGIPSPTLDFLPEPVSIRSSSNGLLLCQSHSAKYYVCNPATGRYQVLPLPQFYHGEPSRAVIVFEPSDDRCFETAYFVVCPFTLPGAGVTYFEIYSSITMMWRAWDADCIMLMGSELKDNGFYANGMLYWETVSGSVVVFDMKFELCSIESLPINRVRGGTLSFLNGNLFYITAYYIDVWRVVINLHEALSMSLKRVMTVVVPFELRSYRVQCRVLPCVNGDTLCCVVGTGAFVVSLKDESVTLVKQEGILFGDEFVPYVNSLVPLEQRK